MFELIARLRSRPLSYRRRVAFWSSVGITAVVVLIWFVTLMARSEAPQAIPTDSTPGPVETLLKRFQNVF